DPLLGSRTFSRATRNQWRAVERIVDIKANRAGFGECEVTVTKRRDLAQRVDSVHFRRVRHARDESVWHALLMASDAADPDVIALGCADDLKLWHGSIPCWSFSDNETTREDGENRQRDRFFCVGSQRLALATGRSQRCPCC